MNDPVVPYNAAYDPFGHGQLDSWQPWSPYGNMPGGIFAQQFMAMAGGWASNQAGQIPMGMGSGGLYNNIRQQAFSQSHMKSMANASQQDMAIMLDMARGMSALAGKQFGAQEEQAISALGSYVLPLSPYVSPELRNLVTGGRSTTNLAHSIHLGGTGRRDAVTGFMGMSGDTSAHIAKGIWQHYYSSPDYGMKTAGLDSLQMGSMFDELTRRGMMVSPGTERQRVLGGLAAIQGLDGPDAITKALKTAGIDPNRFNGGQSLSTLTDTELSKLGKDSAVQSGMRSTDAGRITQTLDKYKGAVAAVQEIFGDHGKPNAPMRELLNALETLTAGGMTQLNPGRMEMAVRNMYNAAKSAGVDMATVSGMMQAAGAQTNALGLNPLFAAQITESGLMFGAAYNAAGLGSNPAWGLMNQKQMMGAHMAAVGRGADSDAANRIGTLLRLEERVGAFGGKTGSMLKSIKAGTFNPDWAMMGYSDFVDMAAKDLGMSKAEIETALTHKEQNSEFVFKNNLGGLIARYAQPEEFLRKVALPEYTEQANMLLRRTLGKGNHGKLAGSIAASALASVRAMPNVIRLDGEARNKQMRTDIIGKLQEAAKANPNGPEAKLLASPDIDKVIGMYAENAYGAAERVGQEQFGMENSASLYTRWSGEADKEFTQTKADVELKSALDKRAAGLNVGGSPLFKFMQAIQQGGQDVNQADLATIIGKAAGGIGKSHLAPKLASDLWALSEREKKLKEMMTTGARAAAGDKTASEQLQSKVEAETKAIAEQRQKIQGFMDDNGLTQTLGSLLEDEKQAAAGGQGGGDANFNMQTVTFNAPEAQIIIKNAKGGGGIAKSEQRGAGAVYT